MGRSVGTYIILFISLVLVQILLCNHIMLFGVAAPIIFFYFLLRLPMGMNVKWVLVLGFLMGLIVDIFSDTPGVNTISCTILAVARKPIYRSFIGNDEALATAVPSIATLGISVAFKYLLSCTLLYCVLCVSLEYFTFASPQRIFSIIGASTILSFILLLGVDSLMGGGRRER